MPVTGGRNFLGARFTNDRHHVVCYRTDDLFDVLGPQTLLVEDKNRVDKRMNDVRSGVRFE